MTEIGSDYNFTSPGGRLAIWKTAFKIIQSNPFTGVGVNCFPRAFAQTRGSEGGIPEWKTAHNSFILLCAEIGVPGFLVFVVLIAGCLKILFLVRITDKYNIGIDDLKDIAGVILIGFFALILSGLFLSQIYHTYFPLFFALSAVMRNLLSKSTEQKAPN
jgi:O-antigen ligase